MDCEGCAQVFKACALSASTFAGIERALAHRDLVLDGPLLLGHRFAFPARNVEPRDLRRFPFRRVAYALQQIFFAVAGEIVGNIATLGELGVGDYPQILGDAVKAAAKPDGAPASGVVVVFVDDDRAPCK